MLNFIDSSLSMLAPSGAMLIGDIPNISMRKRFFASDTGKAYHKEFMSTEQNPDVHFNCIEPNLIDDGLLIGLLLRARLAGFNAFIVPQDNSLPMANRREDIIIIRP
jgi:hypothetical protein